MRSASIRAFGPGRRPVAICLGALAGMVPAGAQARAVADPSAVAAATATLSEKGQLHRTGRNVLGLTLNEEGSASGTISATMYIHLSIVSRRRMTAEVNLYPAGGSLSGQATATYRVAGRYEDFSGTMSIARGTGRYAHAHATGLRFAGRIKRAGDAITVEVAGKLSY